jgi:sulfur-oxidizing protein SoxY
MAAAGFGLPVANAQKAGEVEELIAKFTGGKKPEQAKVSLNTPEIAENGNTVPIGVSVESPMTEKSYVTDVMILADGNPRAGVVTFKFSPMSGTADAQTRIRLAKTQNVIAIAKTSDGGVFMDKKLVKVTIGGCGG